MCDKKTPLSETGARNKTDLILVAIVWYRTKTRLFANIYLDYIRISLFGDSI